MNARQKQEFEARAEEMPQQIDDVLEKIDEALPRMKKRLSEIRKGVVCRVETPPSGRLANARPEIIKRFLDELTTEVKEQTRFLRNGPAQKIAKNNGKHP